MKEGIVPDANDFDVLRNIASCFGTPTYAYDLTRIRSQVRYVRTSLPSEVQLLYSLKANSVHGICELMSSEGLGADVASHGELLTALDAGFSANRIFVMGPYKSPEVLDIVQSRPEIVVSVDSLGELEILEERQIKNPLLLRLRPDFDSAATVSLGCNSRFGIPIEELRNQATRLVALDGLNIVGFHVFSGSQLLDTEAVFRHLKEAMALSIRAAELLSFEPQVLNLGGGFGVPYGPDHPKIRLEDIGQLLEGFVRGKSGTRIIIELGRYFVAEAGWYLTKVVGHQTFQGRSAVVVDGGVHQRADICGLNLCGSAFPPRLLSDRNLEPQPTDVLGCLCLPGDVLARGCPLPPLSRGDVLAFRNAGAYGFSASPLYFLKHPLPAEVGFEGTRTRLLRPRQVISSFQA